MVVVVVVVVVVVENSLIPPPPPMSLQALRQITTFRFSDGAPSLV